MAVELSKQFDKKARQQLEAAKAKSSNMTLFGGAYHQKKAQTSQQTQTLQEHEQHKQAVQKLARRTAKGGFNPKPFASAYKKMEAEFAAKMLAGTDVVSGAQSKSLVVANSRVVPKTATSLTKTSFWSGFSNEVTKPEHWVIGTLKYAGEKYGMANAPIYKELSKEYNILSKGIKELNIFGSKEISTLENEAIRLSSVYKGAYFAADILGYTGKVVGTWGLPAIGAYEFIKSPTVKTAFEVTGMVGGGIAGGFLGTAVAGVEEAILPVLSTPAAIATDVAVTATGITLGKMFTEWAYEKLENYPYNAVNR